MRLLADLHISPRTVGFLRSLGHDIVRVNEVLPTGAADKVIVARAIEDRRTILTQDLDFSNIIALSHQDRPSLITLRLTSSRVERVNEVLASVLPTLEVDVERGVLATVTDMLIRRRPLPVG